MSDGFYDDEDEREDDDERPSHKSSRRRDAETSKQATQGMDAPALRDRIVEVLRSENRPMTAEEINLLVPVDGQSGNPRYNELMEEGRICKARGFGKNQSGKKAGLWRLPTREEGVFLRRFVSLGFGSDARLHEMYEADPAFDAFLQKMRWNTYLYYLRRYNKVKWDELKNVPIDEFMADYEIRGGRLRKRR